MIKFLLIILCKIYLVSCDKSSREHERFFFFYEKKMKINYKAKCKNYNKLVTRSSKNVLVFYLILTSLRLMRDN